MYLVIYNFEEAVEMRARTLREVIDWFYEYDLNDLINWKELDETGQTESSDQTWIILDDPGYGYDAPLLSLYGMHEEAGFVQYYESDPNSDVDPDQMRLFEE